MVAITYYNILVVQHVTCPFKNVWEKLLFNLNSMGKVKQHSYSRAI